MPITERRSSVLRTHLRQAVFRHVSAHWRPIQMSQFEVFEGVIAALFEFNCVFTFLKCSTEYRINN